MAKIFYVVLSGNFILIVFATFNFCLFLLYFRQTKNTGWAGSLLELALRFKRPIVSQHINKPRPLLVTITAAQEVHGQ